MSTLERLTRTTEERVPTAPESHRRTTDEFLNYFEHRLLAALDAGRQLLLTDTSAALQGQMDYFRNSMKTIRWLRSMNKQRRKHARTSPPG